MTIERFVDALKAELVQKIEGQIEYRTVRKNNGVLYHGIQICQKRETIMPYIYVERYLEEYERGRELSDIIQEILHIWETQVQKIKDQTLDFRFEALKDQIVYRLIHYEKNRELLEGIPYIPLLDLAVTFHVAMIREQEEVGMFRIEQNHLDTWGVTLAEVMRLAIENTPRLFPQKIYPLEELVGLPPDILEGMSDTLIPMYVISNKNGINGASAILYPAVLPELAEDLQANLYLLPSSIHEFIAIPFQREYDINRLREVVREVNRYQVPEEEYLSDEVYYYDRKRAILHCV